MNQEKELRNLYNKGYMIGDRVNIQLKSPVGGRDEEDAYIKLAEKDDIVNAQLVKNDNTVFFQAIFENAIVNIPLSEGKVR